MEASENPQLPLDHGRGGGGADGVVRAIDDRLVVERLTVNDERAARVVRERAEAGQAGPDTVAKAIEIGARVLDSEETAVNVDYVRAELERQSASLAERLTKTLEAGDQQLAERIGIGIGVIIVAGDLFLLGNDRLLQLRRFVLRFGAAWFHLFAKIAY